MPYKWESPYEWLEEQARQWTSEQLYRELMELARQLDSDTLQDVYQEDMVRGGYFCELGVYCRQEGDEEEETEEE